MTTATGRMERAQAYLANWKEFQNEIGRALLGLNIQQTISRTPRSRFLRQADLPEDARAAVAERTRHQVEKLFANARLWAASKVEELEHIGILGTATANGADAMVRWAAHSSLAQVLEQQVVLCERGYDTVISHALKASLAFAEQQARCRTYADIVAYGAFRDAGVPVDAYEEAWRSGMAAPMALAESLLRHSLSLLNEKYGHQRGDAAQLRGIASVLGATIVPGVDLGTEPAIAEQRSIAAGP